MKNLLRIAVIFSITICSQFSTAQQQISIAIYQDTRLAFLGDDKGNDAGTLNLLTRFKMQGHQQKHGYMIVFPEFEYANIDGQYKRWSVNVGYTFNRLELPNFEASASIGYGWIERYSVSTKSWSAASELAYDFGVFKLSLVAQLTERSDLLVMYDKNELRFSGFAGVDVNVDELFNLIFK